ncbi:PRC-barrel domain-containing protein [Plastoroseomonas hellenica]|uniref:PRC-barrel domain-containing protein n=1 Tax=Plastoroseomonas hellenica TaxID=2687306 RepID=UPI001BA661D5|nr:PRC-barrel domain-containing protein [Plastoroseomonas hellenica]MBR0645393.1 hypothetical protein [Plastoroseomonas hellenica]
MRRHVLASFAFAAGAMLLPGSILAQGQPANPGARPAPMPPTEPGSSTPAPVRPSPEATSPGAPRSSSAPASQGLEGQRASALIGSNVYNDGNDSIGSVRDLLLAPQGGQMTAVLSVGGFLGIGSKDVAVPFTELRWNAERERWVLPGATAENLRARPEFNFRNTR